MRVFSKSPISFLIDYISIKKGHTFGDFFLKGNVTVHN